MCHPFLHVGGEQRVQQIIHVVLLLQGCLPAHPDTVTLGGLPGGDRPLDFFKDTQIGGSS